MKLTEVRVQNYKSIDDSGWVRIDNVTCLVGKNESGKTTFLNALKKMNPEDGDGDFDPVMDYPRKGYSKYKKIHDENPADVISTRLILTEKEVSEIENELGKDVLLSNNVEVVKNYKNMRTWRIQTNEKVTVDYWVDKCSIENQAIKQSLYESNTLKELFDKLKELQSSDDKIQELINNISSKLSEECDLLNYIIDKYLMKYMPKFVYFDDYNIMKGDISIPYLSAKKQQGNLDDSEKTFLSLLSLAGVGLQDFQNQQNYERLKADLEAASISITDEVFTFWSQNRQLEIHFDIFSADPKAIAPLNQGPILHIRIYNKKHRVTVSFSERSKGFVWFFSFLAYFSELEEKDTELILLLDEPGLSLHAKAQNDFLIFIDKRLAPKNQVIYTTHSPFMIDPKNLSSVRTVEDIEDCGTIISDEILKNDKDTVFPLQAAMGYELMQTLFLGPNCLLVEGPSDLIYLQVLDEAVRKKGHPGLNEQWVITPVGGADKVSTFVTLLGANQLNVAVLMDFSEKDLQRVNNLISNSLLRKGNLIKINEFVNATDADIEDLFDIEFYLNLVNKSYGLNISKDKLESRNPRIIKRIEEYFKKNNFEKNHFNHYKPAVTLLSEQNELVENLTEETILKVTKLFDRLNSLIK